MSAAIGAQPVELLLDLDKQFNEGCNCSLLQLNEFSSLIFQMSNGKPKYTTSIHPFSAAYPVQGHGGLEPIPAVYGQEMESHWINRRADT